MAGQRPRMLVRRSYEHFILCSLGYGRLRHAASFLKRERRYLDSRYDGPGRWCWQSAGRGGARGGSSENSTVLRVLTSSCVHGEVVLDVGHRRHFDAAPRTVISSSMLKCPVSAPPIEAMSFSLSCKGGSPPSICGVVF